MVSPRTRPPGSSAPSCSGSRGRPLSPASQPGPGSSLQAQQRTKNEHRVSPSKSSKKPTRTRSRYQKLVIDLIRLIRLPLYLLLRLHKLCLELLNLRLGSSVGFGIRLRFWFRFPLPFGSRRSRRRPWRRRHVVFGFPFRVGRRGGHGAGLPRGGCS